MNYLRRRIKAVEGKIKARNGHLMTVHYKDGSTRQMYPGEAIAASLEDAAKIERIEEDPGGSNGGIVEGLVKALLLPGADHGKDGTQ